MTREGFPEHLENLFDGFLTSSDPEYLARYIEDGGNISKALRGYIAKVIRDYAPKPHGNSTRPHDHAFYEKVEAWRTSEENAPIYQYLKKSDLTLQEILRAFSEIPKKKRPSLESAYRHFETNLHLIDIEDIEDEKIDDVEGINDDNFTDVGTLRKKYNRGQKIEKSRISNKNGDLLTK